MWLFIIFLIIVGGLITLYTVEAWIDLDRWIADAPNREKNNYKKIVEHNSFTTSNTNLLNNLNINNFPKTNADLKNKIDRLMKK